MKRLAVFFDGTWNRPSARTSVCRLHELTADRDPEGVAQLTWYRPGVGTRWGEWLRGGVLGVGTSRNVRDAYAWLAANYDDGDHVFVFGFSRGAYSARSLAGMISRCGLLTRGARTGVDEVYRRYAAEDGRLVPGARRIDIHFVGVWDTVGALGVPWGRIRGLSRSTMLFHNTNPSARYRNMFQALAIDEHRAEYRPTLWTASQAEGVPLRPLEAGQTLEQRWFVGAHSDVGGHRQDPSLARLPLAWLWERAEECGLRFTAPVPLDGEEHLLPVSDSFGTFLHGLYRVARLNRRHHRTIGRGPVRTEGGDGLSHSLNETIDGSVFDRWREDGGYRPPNLAAWARRRRCDPAALRGTTPAGDAVPAAPRRPRPPLAPRPPRAAVPIAQPRQAGDTAARV